MTEDEGMSWTSVVLKLIIAIVVAAPLSIVTGFILATTNIVPISWIPLSSLISGICFFFGTLYFIQSLDYRKWFYSILIGFACCVGTIVLGLGILLLQIQVPLVGNALNVIIIAVIVVAIIGMSLVPEDTIITKPSTVVTSSKSITHSLPKLGLSLNRPDNVAAIKVTTVPKDYFEKDRAIAGQFHSIVRHAVLSGVPLGIRLERIRNENNILILTWSKDQCALDRQLQIIHDTLKSNLSDFSFEVIQQYSGIQLTDTIQGAADILTGIPLSLEDGSQRIDALTLAAGVLQEMSNGVVQVFIEPFKVKQSDISSLEYSYKRAAEASETVISKPRSGFFSHGEQESKTQVDLKSKRKSEILRRQIDRLSSKHICKTTVSTVCWSSDISTAVHSSQRLAGSLMGALLPDTKDVDFQLHSTRKAKDIVKLLRGIPTGKTSLLATEEAVAYCILPQIDLGLQMTSREAFSTATRPVPRPPPQTTPPRVQAKTSKVEWKWTIPYVFLGNPLRKNGERLGGQLIWLEPENLDSHIGIFGNTRSGKTTTALSVIAQACRMGVNPVILVPSKPQDWRVLKLVFPNLRIFTAGDPDTSPLRFNIWNPPPNVPLDKWLARIVQIFCTWLPNDRVLKIHFDDVVHQLYNICGWSSKGKKKGRPVLLTDLIGAINKVGQKLLYGDEVLSNVFGALVARLDSMLRNYSLADMYNTESGLTITELLEHPTIIEMDRLHNDDKLLLTGLLTAGISEYKMANPSTSVTNLLVLEEAHHLLKRHGDGGLDGPTIRHEAVEGIIEMLRVAGGTGLGIVLIDQLPGSMVPEAVKLPVNIIIHALNDPNERYLVGKHARCTDSQIEHISGMRKGEVIVYLEGDDGPKNVNILPLEFYLSHKFKKEAFTTKFVKSSMAPIFEEHPHLSSSIDIPQDILENMVKPSMFEKKKPPKTGKKNIAISTAESPRFLKLLSENLATSESAAINFILKVASKTKGPDENEREVAERILERARGVLTDPMHIELTEKLLVQLQEESTA